MFDKNRLTPDDPTYPDIDDINDAVRKVRSLVADELNAGSESLESALYESARCYLQAHVRRALMFLDGGAQALEAGYGLVTLTCARSLWESTACVHDFGKKLCAMMDEDDVVSATKFVHQRTFSTRFQVEQMNHDDFDYTAVNILKQIDALEKVIPAARRNYDQLSETVHPNAYGAHAYFELTREGGVARFSNTHKDRELYSLFASSAGLLSLVYRTYLDIDISFLALMERELGNRIKDYERRKALGLVKET
ncbi:hypothetical protein [Bradyrhizobium sp. USDA 3262]